MPYKNDLVHGEVYQVITYNKKSIISDDVVSTSEQLAKLYIKEANKRQNKNKNKRAYITGLDSQNNYIRDTTSDNAEVKSFMDYFRENFSELHPLFNLCRVSLIFPLLFNSIFFVFNTLILFGFNALLYYESLIEKRIYENKRNNLDYPMRKEFHKIILSILC